MFYIREWIFGPLFDADQRCRDPTLARLAGLLTIEHIQRHTHALTAIGQPTNNRPETDEDPS